MIESRILGAEKRGRRARFGLSLLLAALHLLPLPLLAPAALADPRPVTIVSAGDAPLATMLLTSSGRTNPVLLFDPRDAETTRRFIAETGGPVSCLVGNRAPAAARAALEAAAGTSCASAGDLGRLAQRLWPEASAAVLAPAADYAWLLRGAVLAASIGAALVPVAGDPVALPPSIARIFVLPGVTPPAVREETHVARIKSADGLTRMTIRALGGQPRTLVVANPRDRDGRFSPSALSLLAPLIAAAHRAPLLLVEDAAADAVEAEVDRVIAANALLPTHIYLVGDELALRSHRVPDPVIAAGGPAPMGGARDVRVELFSQVERGRPQDYAVGRFVAEDAARGSATLARQLHAGLGAGEPVWILANADQEFQLGETVSRSTARELRNAGVPVKARYRDAVTPAVIKRALGEAGLLLWEGHARDLTLEERGGIAVERTPPLVVLQGCYTLDRSDPFILFERGTQAIVATSAAIYSASGSSFARAFLDALLYEGADLGIAVRNARNYLFALTELKKHRGHSDWPKTYRAALAFALWGDPTARPALPVKPPRVAPASWRVDGSALALDIPKRRLKPAAVGPYSAEPVPRAMLSGLLLRDGERAELALKELFFDAFPAPAGVAAACPPAPGWDVISLFAPRTGTLSVLARPPGSALGRGAQPGDYRLPLVADASRCAVR